MAANVCSTLLPAVVPLQQRVEGQQAAALEKAAALGGSLPTFKKAGVAQGSSSDGKGGAGGGRGVDDGRLTLGQLARKGLEVDVSVTEPAKTAAEERACRLESERMARDLQAKLQVRSRLDLV